MKRVLFFSLGLTLFLAINTGNAYAVCQTCKDAGTIDGMCWTLGACEMGATMGACVERVSFTGAVTCDSIGSHAGPECNGNDASCHSGGGGGGGGVSDPGMGGTTCLAPISMGCPAECNQCIFYRDIWPIGPF